MNPLGNILDGVVICISQALRHKREELRDLSVSLGAQFEGEYFSDKCTHFLHQSSKQNETFKDFRNARKKNMFIVSPIWLEKCKESGIHQEEKDYPHIYSSKGILEFKIVKKREINNIHDDLITEEENNVPSSSNFLPNAVKTPELVKKMRTMDDDDDCSQGNHPGVPYRMVSPNGLIRMNLLEKILEKNRINEQETCKTKTPKKSIVEKDKQSLIYDEVLYDDPEGRKEKEKLIERLK
jgi:hypothetical protein